MAKLPEKLVQPPVFDSPLRRTELSLIDETEPVTRGPEPTEPVRTSPEREVEQLDYRVTVRLSRRQWEAVQTECFRLRMLGQKTNAAALVRDIVDTWIQH